MAIIGTILLLSYMLIGIVGLQVLQVIWSYRPSLGPLLIYFLIVILLTNYLSFRYGMAAILHELHTIKLPQHAAPTFYQRFHTLSQEFEISTPTVYIASLEAPNALALGTASNGAVIIDRRLFRILSLNELDAVIAHELAHLENGDGLMQTLGLTTIRTIGGILYLLLFPVGIVVGGMIQSLSLIWGRQRSAQPIMAYLHQFILIILFVLTIVLRAHSRRREYFADDRAVEITQNPLGLARALQKIDRASRSIFDPLTILYTHGDDSNDLNRLLASHPPLEERISRLHEQAKMHQSNTHQWMPITEYR